MQEAAVPLVYLTAGRLREGVGIAEREVSCPGMKEEEKHEKISSENREKEKPVIGKG